MNLATMALAVSIANGTVALALKIAQFLETQKARKAAF